MASNNPFSRGYGQIIAAMENFGPLMAQVRLANIQDMQRQGFKVRTNIAAADRVEIRLLEKRIRSKPFSANSLYVAFDCVYPLAIASGKMGVDKGNLITTLVLQALTSAGPYLGLQQADIIQKWEFVDASAIPKDDAAGRPDWTINGGVLVYFAMRRQDFLTTAFT